MWSLFRKNRRFVENFTICFNGCCGLDRTRVLRESQLHHGWAIRRLPKVDGNAWWESRECFGSTFARRCGETLRRRQLYRIRGCVTFPKIVPLNKIFRNFKIDHFNFRAKKYYSILTLRKVRFIYSWLKNTFFIRNQKIRGKIKEEKKHKEKTYSIHYYRKLFKMFFF